MLYIHLLCSCHMKNNYCKKIGNFFIKIPSKESSYAIFLLTLIQLDTAFSVFFCRYWFFERVFCQPARYFKSVEKRQHHKI